MDVKDLRAKRARIHNEEVKPIVAKGEWTAEDREKFDKADAEIVALTADIERAERAAKLEADHTERAADPAVVPDAADAVDTRPVAGKEYAEAFEAYVRFGMDSLEPEQRAALRAGRPRATQSTTTGAEGGYTVSTGFEKDVIEARKAFGGLREVAGVKNTSSGNTIELPTHDDTTNTGRRIAQNAAAVEKEMVFGQKTWGAHKYTSDIVLHPQELLEDEEIGLEQLTNTDLVTRILRITHTEFTTGAGAGAEPEGVVTASEKGADALAVAAIAYADFVNLEHGVNRAYRDKKKARYMFADTTLKALKGLKDEANSDRPLWVPSVREGEPDTINGYAYVINDDMAAIAASAKSVLFGDFSFYWIRDVRGMRLRRLVERYAENDQVGFLAFSRHDGLLTDTKAVKHLLHPAA